MSVGVFFLSFTGHTKQQSQSRQVVVVNESERSGRNGSFGTWADEDLLPRVRVERGAVEGEIILALQMFRDAFAS